MIQTRGLTFLPTVYKNKMNLFCNEFYIENNELRRRAV
jgi:hypothetical protein